MWFILYYTLFYRQDLHAYWIWPDPLLTPLKQHELHQCSFSWKVRRVTRTSKSEMNSSKFLGLNQWKMWKQCKLWFGCLLVTGFLQWASLFKWGSDTSGCYFILEHLQTFFSEWMRDSLNLLQENLSTIVGDGSLSLLLLLRERWSMSLNNANSVNHDPMTNINMTFFQANFSGYYSPHSLMMVFMEIPVCPLHTFPNS
jgi:hypothetical protein